jgi:hypothetical protein
MKFYTINNVSGSSNCLFNVYYDSISSNTIASVYGPNIPYLLATGLTFSQISSGNLVIVIPDSVNSIIISDTCGSGCPPVVNIFPSPTPTNTMTQTPTKTKTATPTQTRTSTPNVTTTNTSTPTKTQTATPTFRVTSTPTQTKTPTTTPTRTPTSQPLPPVGRPFISVWRTTTWLEEIELPYEPSGFFDGTIQWGDGSSSINSYANRKHTYTVPGTYTVTILGRIIGWSFNWTCPGT